MGTNTDPYQRAEGRYRLMPGIDRGARPSRARRSRSSPRARCCRGTSRCWPPRPARCRWGWACRSRCWTRRSTRALEPGHADARRPGWSWSARITDAGLPCGVFIAPVLPGLTDSSRAAGRSARRHRRGRRHRRDGAGAAPAAGREGMVMAWLGREHPELVPRYRRLYGRGAYVPAEYRRRWSAASRRSSRRTASAGRPGERRAGCRATTRARSRPAACRPPGRPHPSLPPAAEQLTLL